MTGVFDLDTLDLPLIAAPMAGGPTTPALVAAAGESGGLGLLAAGYRTVDTVARDVDAVRSTTDATFGVNVFVPAAADSDPERAAAVERYRTELAPDAAARGIRLAGTDPADTDGWAEKIAYLIENPVPVVSFMFGVPDPDTVAGLQAVGTHVMITVTDVGEAVAAAAAGADSLCVQGPDAGGHRGTHTVAKQPDTSELAALLADVAGRVSMPLVAAGGVGAAADVARLIRAGARAVQVGTLLVTSTESGASVVHKAALLSGRYEDTRTTRAFSGRYARSLVNGFVSRHHATAPAAYPEVNQLVRPLRAAAAAAGDADGVALWAGAGHAHCRSASASEILTDLASALPRR